MAKISFVITREMVDKLKDPTIKQRPYDLCMVCSAIGRTCDGPNLLAVSMPRWIELVRAEMKKRGMTIADVSNISGIPRSTINSIFSGETPDPRYSTIMAITKAVFGESWGRYPCHVAAMLLNGEIELKSDEDVTEEEASAVIQRLELLVDDFKQTTATKNEEALREKYEGVIAEKDKRIAEKDERISEHIQTITDLNGEKKLLRRALAIMAVIIVGLFALDLVIGSIGWFRF